MSRRQLIAILCFLTVTASAPAAIAQSPKAERPDKLTVTVGDVLIRIDGPKLWTLSGVDYRDSPLSVEDSAYGSVFNIRGVGILGSAHFLDVPGKPGEVEKEQVSRVEFFVDDLPVKDFLPTMTLAGKSFRMERESTIRSVQLTSRVTLREGVLVETARMQTPAAVDLKVCYPLMQAWSPRMSAYLFGNADGVLKRGSFRGEAEKPSEGLEKLARWMAVYSSRDGKGAVVYVLQQPSQADAWLQFTDAPGIYRKVRLMTFVERPMPAGFDGTFQWAVTGFTAAEADWESVAQERVRQLQKR